MTQKGTLIVVGLVAGIGGALLGLGLGFQLWAGEASVAGRYPIEGSEKKVMIEESPSHGLSVWVPARQFTQINVSGEKIGDYDKTTGLVNIYRKGEERKVITSVRVLAPGKHTTVLRADFYPETGAVKHIRIRRPDGDHLGSAKLRKDGTVKSLERFKSHDQSTVWKFDREGNIVDEYSVGHSWD